MDRGNEEELVAFFSTIAIFLQHVVTSMSAQQTLNDVANNSTDRADPITTSALEKMETVISSVLHDFCLRHAGGALGEELGFWVKPRSMAWFSQFLMFEYDNSRWVENFRMSTEGVQQLTRILAPRLERKDTNYLRSLQC